MLFFFSTNKTFQACQSFFFLLYIEPTSNKLPFDFAKVIYFSQTIFLIYKIRGMNCMAFQNPCMNHSQTTTYKTYENWVINTCYL